MSEIEFIEIIEKLNKYTDDDLATRFDKIESIAKSLNTTENKLAHIVEELCNISNIQKQIISFMLRTMKERDNDILCDLRELKKITVQDKVEV